MNFIGVVIKQVGFFLKKHGPSIMVYAGAGGLVGAGVMACVKTTHLDEVKQAHKERVEEAQKQDEEVRRHELTKAYFKSAAEIAKLYLPSVLLGAASLASVLGGHNIIRKRGAAMAAAYASLDGAYRKYRERVAEMVGAEAENDIFLSKKKVVRERKEVGEDGEIIRTEETIEVVDADADEKSEFTFFFEEGKTRAYEPDEGYNMFFLELQERLANDQLRANGFLLLNDVLQMLGFDRTKAGAVTGWVYDPKNADEYKADNYVSFHIQPIYKEGVDGDEYVETIRLDFNVDGMVLEHASRTKALK